MVKWLAFLLTCCSCFGQAFTFADPGFVGSLNVAATQGSSLTNGLTAYWRLDSSASWADASGNGYTLLNAAGAQTPTNQVGLITNAAACIASAFLTNADNDVWSAIDSNSLTFALWFKADTAGVVNALIAKDKEATAGSEEYYLRWRNTDNMLRWSIYTNAAAGVGVSYNAALSTGTWYFVCAAIDTTNWVGKLRYGTTSTLYDWTNTATFAGFGPDNQGTNTGRWLEVGGYSATSSYTLRGLLDEVGVWRRLLTDAEVTNLWNNGSGRTYPFN